MSSAQSYCRVSLGMVTLSLVMAGIVALGSVDVWLSSKIHIIKNILSFKMFVNENRRSHAR